MAPHRGSLIRKGVPKVHNADRAFSAKAAIRRNVLDQIGRHLCHVFDVFAGPGAMYSEAWCHAKTYVGCDKEPYSDDRTLFCGDSRRVLRAIDLGAFNVFDVDSYGSPWEIAVIIAARRKASAGEKIGLVLTEGTGLKLMGNQLPHAMKILSGVNGGTGLFRNHAPLIDRSIAGIATRMNATTVKRWEAVSTKEARMRYIGLVLEGKQ